MKWTLVDPAGMAPVPWKNGGGVTRELLAWPAAADWRVRVSIADVERDGPFSAYPGVQRWFAVLEGEGVHLRIGPCEYSLDAKTQPLEFDGAAPVECRLAGGATRDFNLMVRGGGGVMKRLQGRVEHEGARGSFVALHAVEDVLVDGVRVPPGHFAWRLLDAGERIDVSATEVLWMEVR